MNYKRIYELIINRSKQRLPPEGYVEHHHIIPRCLGGSDDKENIAVLTPEEHFLCHVLLVKINPEETGLIYAVNKMCCGHKGKRKRRKLYGWLKRKFSEQRKLDSAGKGNTQYGTMWINKIGTTENRKIKKNEPIPKGWVKGRRLTKEDNNSYCVFCNIKIKKGAKYCQKHQYMYYRENGIVEETERLYKKYIKGNCSLQKLADEINISKVALHYRFKKYID